MNYFIEKDLGVFFWKKNEDSEWKGIEIENFLGKLGAETELIFDYEDKTPQASKKIYTCRECRYQIADPKGFKFCPYCGKKISYTKVK